MRTLRAGLLGCEPARHQILALYAPGADAMDGAGCASPACRSGRPVAGLDDTGTVPAHPPGLPVRTPGGAVQHVAGEPGDGPRRRPAPAPGRSVRPYTRAARRWRRG